MKTYQSDSKEKKTKKNFFMKNIYGILFGATLLVVAGIITLSLLLKGPGNVLPGPDDGVDKPTPKPTFSVPLDEYTLGQLAALDKLVYSSTLNQWRTHNGVDFITGAKAAVKSVSSGKVESIEKTTLEGTVITIAHADGLKSIYKGLADEVSLKVGDDVNAGTVIGSVAENMMIEQREGAHLHLEMKVAGAYVDPAKYLPELADEK